MRDPLVVDDPQVDPDRAEWVSRLAAATNEAIGRLRKFDDPVHTELVDDLQAFHERLVGELEG